MKPSGEPRADVGALMGLSGDSLPAAVSPAVVGWMVDLPHSVRGVGHVCARCRPTQPSGMVPVYGGQLAADAPCRMCRLPLEVTP